jgi:hypothetical protein
MADNDRWTVPGPATENNERITARPYESNFAFLPDEEIHDTDTPGSGPSGPYQPSLSNWPLALMVLGLLVVVLATAVDSAIVLLVGLVLAVVGGLWAAFRDRGSASGKGTGPVVIEH